MSNKNKNKFPIWNYCSWKEDRELFKPFITEKSSESIFWVARKVQELRERLTDSEICVARYLNRNHAYYIPQAPFFIEGHFYFADFYFPSINTILEVDGSSHNSPEHQELDKQRDIAFESIGINTIRITNRAVQLWHFGIIPIPQREDKPKRGIIYLKEGESGIYRAKIEAKIKQILNYK